MFLVDSTTIVLSSGISYRLLFLDLSLNISKLDFDLSLATFFEI